MQAKASQQTNKWLGNTKEQFRSTASNSQTIRSLKTEEQRPSNGTISNKDLLFSVGEGPRLTSRQLQDLLNTPENKCDQGELKQVAFALLEQAKFMENQTRREQQEELGTSSLSQSLQSRVDHAKFRRSALIHEQEALRAEILQLNHRIKKLESLKESCLPAESKSKKHIPTINQRKIKPSQIEKELLELGVKKQLTLEEQIAKNDQEVISHNSELLVRQRAAIDEMSKFELLKLKKPHFVLLMDRLAK